MKFCPINPVVDQLVMELDRRGGGLDLKWLGIETIGSG